MRNPPCAGLEGFPRAASELSCRATFENAEVRGRLASRIKEKDKPMKRTMIAALLALTAPAALLVTSFAAEKKEPVRHVVVFKYKAGATEDQIRQVTDAFRALKGKIPGILAFEHGVNDSPEKKNLGFTHVYLLTFEDAKARDAYLPHPEHKRFGELLGRLGVLEDAFVVDFKPGK